MDENKWNMASNSQLKEELNRLDNEFNARQTEMEEIVSKIDVLHEEMNNLSKSYIEIKKILDKREGKTSQ